MAEQGLGRRCGVPGCNRPHAGHGYCGGHLRRLKRYGDVQADVPLGQRGGGVAGVIPVGSFSAVEVQTVAGVTHRQLDYWARTGLLMPSVLEGVGSGHPRAYSKEDLDAAVVIARLVRKGFDVSQLAQYSRAQRRAMADAIEKALLDTPAVESAAS